MDAKSKTDRPTVTMETILIVVISVVTDTFFMVGLIGPICDSGLHDRISPHSACMLPIHNLQNGFVNNKHITPPPPKHPLSDRVPHESQTENKK